MNQQRLVGLPYCRMIITVDLTYHDFPHYTPEGYQVIGRRFAEAYLSIAQAPKR